MVCDGAGTAHPWSLLSMTSMTSVQYMGKASAAAAKYRCSNIIEGGPLRKRKNFGTIAHRMQDPCQQVRRRASPHGYAVCNIILLTVCLQNWEIGHNRNDECYSVTFPSYWQIGKPDPYKERQTILVRHCRDGSKQHLNILPASTIGDPSWPLLRAPSLPL